MPRFVAAVALAVALAAPAAAAEPERLRAGATVADWRAGGWDVRYETAHHYLVSVADDAWLDAHGTDSLWPSAFHLAECVQVTVAPASAVASGAPVHDLFVPCLRRLDAAAR